MQVKQMTNLKNISKTKIITNLNKFNISRTSCKTVKKIKEINKVHYLKQNKMLKLLKVPESLYINIYCDMKYCLRRAVPLTKWAWYIFHKHSQNLHQWNAYDSRSSHVETVLLWCVSSKNSPGSSACFDSSLERTSNKSSNAKSCFLYCMSPSPWMPCRSYTAALLNGILLTVWFGWNFQNISFEIEAWWLVSGLRKYAFL